MNRTFKTDLRCAACVQAIAPLFDAAPEVLRWSADVSTPDKTLTVEGDGATLALVDGLLRQKGYRALGEMSAAAPPGLAAPAEPKESYFPLALILLYLLGAVGLAEAASPAFDAMRAMNRFMAGFFLVFSFFKLLDLPAFAASFAGYDVVASRWPRYGYVYPFIELALGAAYLAQWQPIATNVATLVVMGIGTVGVTQSLLAKRRIRCACLGGIFNLPMSYVTLAEDLLMIAMALAMLCGVPRHGVG